ncbi:agmatinase [Caldichromatium japonicum]|uniref:Agmatinase n=1 Tax=Caldichromatium japonicum TaxID=2699430 RepID=A0A6G7VCG0_9GAMM|nr:agmatinase [Caldichromatium japonicum]QIK37654.1 agmatinase [Caldichromatium japonicum]
MNDNPAFGAHLQPLMGITSFMRQPASRDLSNTDAVILGIPYDSAVSYRSGARFGPRKIRELSVLLWGHHPALKVSPLEHLRLIDYGDVEVVPTSILYTMEAIEATAAEIIASGAVLIALGGDHSITLPLLRAHARRYGPLALVHLDAHLDTWESEFAAVPYSHGTPFRHALQEGLIRKGAYVQIGIRGPVMGPADYAEARALGAYTVTAQAIMERGIPDVLAEILPRLAGPVYLSLDIDIADPAYAPGTGTPEVGGLTSHQLLQLVRGLKGLNLIGFDLVEVCPPYDCGEITAILAANLVFEYLSLLALKRSLRPRDIPEAGAGPSHEMGDPGCR